MTSSRSGVCGWCGEEFVRAGRGPVGVYCSAAHRQAAHRARTPPPAVVVDGGLGEALDDLEAIVAVPGQFAQFALWGAARRVLRAAGRPVDDTDLPDPPGRPVDAVVRPSRVRWDGRPLPHPARLPARRYARQWAGSDWEIRVWTLRAGRPVGAGSLLRRRQHPDHPADVYRWTDPFGVTDSAALHRLAAALIADAVDLPEGARGRTGRNSDLNHIAAHLTGDILAPLGDNAWAVDSAEIVNWLTLHHYLPKPVT